MDTMTISIAIGLLVSLAVTEIFGMTAGGMIVPGYFALSVQQPLSLIFTLLAALATFAVVKFLSQHMLVYGRRRIVLALLLGFILGSSTRLALLNFADPHAASYMTVIGFIIPGLIALWFDRQGVRGTIGSLATATVLVRLALIIVGVEVAL